MIMALMNTLDANKSSSQQWGLLVQKNKILFSHVQTCTLQTIC